MSTAQSHKMGGKKAVHVKWAGKTIALGTFAASEADEKCARAKALTRAWRSTMRPKPSREWVMLELERLGVRQVSGRLGRKGGEGDGDEMEGAGPGMERSNSLGWPGADDLNSIMQRRSSSLGFNMMDDDLNRRNSSMGLGMPAHRPLVGGGAAAAYEAARADHYSQKGQGGDGGPRRPSGLGGLGMGGGGAVNPNQHYEMLKLHHMNLLNEIQETTLMMNLYQQQQLQQQQQQLQNGADPSIGGPMNPMFPVSGRSSLGLGAPGLMVPNGGGEANNGGTLDAAQEEQKALEERLQKLKDDIAQRQKEAEELEAASSGNKRKADRDDDKPIKKMKEEEGEEVNADEEV